MTLAEAEHAIDVAFCKMVDAMRELAAARDRRDALVQQLHDQQPPKAQRERGSQGKGDNP